MALRDRAHESLEASLGRKVPVENKGVDGLTQQPEHKLVSGQEPAPGDRSGREWSQRRPNDSGMDGYLPPPQAPSSSHQASVTEFTAGSAT